MINLLISDSFAVEAEEEDQVICVVFFSQEALFMYVMFLSFS